MPGARLRTFRLGDRAELLAEQLLAAFAFTTPVPRTEDVGIDFFCSMIHQEEDGKLLRAGPFFAVQAKSSKDPIAYEKAHELEWIKNQENPLLICVADRDSLAMDVYSTWNLTCGVLHGWRGQRQADRIVLAPGATHNVWPWVNDKDDGSQEICLGAPVARITDADIFDDARMEPIINAIGEWVALDRTNIVNRDANMHWVVAPLSYRTNIPPRINPATGMVLYTHPENIGNYSANLGRIATTLTFALRNLGSGIDTTQKPWSLRMSTLTDLLIAHWDLHDEPTRQFLILKGIKP